MATLEFLIPAADSEAFNTAVYRFLEARGSATDDSIMKLTTEPWGPVHRKSVTLWSDAALHDFTLYWSSFRRTFGRPNWARTRTEEGLTAAFSVEDLWT